MLRLTRVNRKSRRRKTRKRPQRLPVKQRRRQWLLKNARSPKPVKAPVRPPRPVRLIPVADALRVLAEYWPPLFNPELPLRRCLRSLTRSEGYLNAALSGSIRYGLNGQPAGVVTEEEYRLSRLRLEKVLKRRE
ncbi:hypothetical protein EO254_23050 [Salmonella enterica subsp. enterica serovar Grumpensis]|nr:hypothetical protein [Salmonella enterica subsp. enterica serovar Grumpensis]